MSMDGWPSQNRDPIATCGSEFCRSQKAPLIPFTRRGSNGKRDSARGTVCNDTIREHKICFHKTPKTADSIRSLFLLNRICGGLRIVSTILKKKGKRDLASTFPALHLRVDFALFNIVDDIRNGFQLFRIFFRDLKAKSFLKGHDELGEVQRIGVEVFDERLFRRHIGSVNTELLDNDINDFLLY